MRHLDMHVTIDLDAPVPERVVAIALDGEQADALGEGDRAVAEDALDLVHDALARADLLDTRGES